jgi:hypothetical protein
MPPHATGDPIEVQVEVEVEPRLEAEASRRPKLLLSCERGRMQIVEL